LQQPKEPLEKGVTKGKKKGPLTKSKHSFQTSHNHSEKKKITQNESLTTNPARERPWPRWKDKKRKNHRGRGTCTSDRAGRKDLKKKKAPNVKQNAEKNIVPTKLLRQTPKKELPPPCPKGYNRKGGRRGFKGDRKRGDKHKRGREVKKNIKGEVP